jgi:hypothetical protein
MTTRGSRLIVAKRKSKTGFKYPGTLGRPADRAPMLARAMEHLGGHPRDVDGATALYVEELADWRKAVLAALFAFHKVDAATPDAWELLAMKLIAAHVPAWNEAEIRKRGRPRKVPESLARRRRGAPTKWTPERMEAVDWLLELGSLILLKQGRPFSNTAALEAGYLVGVERGYMPGWTKKNAREAARRDARRISDIDKALREQSLRKTPE